MDILLMKLQFLSVRYPSGELWLYLGSILTILIIYWLRPWLKGVKVALQLPGPPALPFLGNVLLAVNPAKIKHIGETLFERYGSVIRIWIMLKPSFVVLEPQDLQLILGSAKNCDKNFFYLLMHNFIGKGMITNNGIEWRSHRKYMQPYFHNNILDTHVPTFATSAEVIVSRLEKDIGSKATKDIKVTTFINDAILDILHEAVLGIPIKLRNGNVSYTADSPFRKGEIVVLERVTKPWLLFDQTYKWSSHASNEEKQKGNLQSYTRKMLERKREEHKNGLISEHKCILEMMMEVAENHEDFTDTDIINETCTFMLAGQDSVGAGTIFSLYHLAANPDIQDKVMKELDEIFQGSDRTPTAEDVRDMKYLEQCIKESMRLCPSVPLIARNISEDVTLGKHTIPAKTDILVSPYVTHRLPHIYPDPEKYDPDRFSPENSEHRHPFAFLPFSAGPRNCIGYKFAYIEIKTLISTILRKFKLSVTPGYKFDVSFRVTLRAKGGVWLRVEPRCAAK